MKIQFKKTTLKTAGWTLSLLLLSQTALAADWAGSNKTIVDDFAVPRFETLLDSSKKLVTQTENFCKKGGDESFEATRQHYHDMMDAWQQVQILRTGPQEFLMRNFRLQMWPDRSNAGAKQVRKLLAEKKTELLKADKFRRSSTAVQGLPALERLLFAKEISASDFYTEKKPTYRCHLVQAIALNINNISANLLKEWQTSYKETVLNPSADNEAFETHKAVASVFLKEAATQLQAVYDQKFKRPLDDKRFRPKRAESWRSGRSLRNITLNLESVESLFKVGFALHLKNEALKEKLEDEFKQVIETGKTFTMPLLKAHEDKAEDLSEWMKQVSQLKRTLTADVPKALDIALGFNSLDGD